MDSKVLKDLNEFLDVVETKIELDEIIKNVKKELYYNDLSYEKALYVINHIRDELLNKTFYICPYNKELVIGEDCSNCFFYGDCETVNCDICESVI